MAIIPQRRERDAEAAREAILQAAEKLFAEKGFAGARIDKIAELSGYNKSLICHQYFEGKEGLYEAVIRRMKQQGMVQMAQILKPAYYADESQFTAEMVHEFLAKAIRTRFNHLLAHENHWRILAWEAADRWSMYSRMNFTQEELGCPLEAIQFVRRAQRAGFIRQEIDPTTLIAHVMGAPWIYLLSLPSYQLLLPGTDFTSPEALIHAREQIVEIIVRGIITPAYLAKPIPAIGNDADIPDSRAASHAKEAHTDM